MSSPDDLAARVMEITGSSRQVALNLLSACANDVQAAIDLFLANEENEVVDVESVVECDPEDGVRAPIAPIREQLIGEDEDNFHQSNNGTGSRAKARSLPRIKVCPLRDFAREGSLMEETLTGSDAIPPLIESDRPTRSQRLVSSARSTRSSTSTSSSSTSANSLGDLFRPPTDITIAGTFQYARTKASHLKRWLLVNVQSDNFNSQLLNRDVWSQVKLRNLIKKNFLLWQVSSDSLDGKRFSTFYHCNETPYVCMIDPRTGEEVWKCEQPNTVNLLKALQAFLEENLSEGFFQSGTSASALRTSTLTASEESSSSLSSTELPTDSRKRTRPVELATELTEEEQILLAVRNSLRENGCGSNANKKSRPSDDDNEEEEEVFHEISDSDDDVQSVPVDSKTSEKDTQIEEAQQEPLVPTEKHTDYLGSCTDEITTLKIRLVNAGVDESVTIRWPSDTKLRALQLYIAEHFPMVKEKFKLISPFPRKVVDLNDETDMQTLKEANLHPSSTLHLHLDD